MLGTSAGVVFGVGYTVVWAFVSDATTSWSLTLGEHAEMLAAGALTGGPSGLLGGLVIGLTTVRRRRDALTPRRRAGVTATAALTASAIPLMMVASLALPADLPTLLRPLALLVVGPAAIAAMTGWTLAPLLLPARHHGHAT